MSLTGALSSGQKALLRGNHTANQYISLVPNTTVFAARVNQASFDDVIAQLTFDNVTTGAYTDCEPGMTVYISHGSDRADYHFRGRVRKDPTSSILYINETSIDVYDNDYIFVVDDYDIFPKLPREVSGTRYNDYDKTFEQLPPVITNIKTAYSDWVSGSPSGYIIRFQPVAVPATSGASISSYQFTIPDGTVTAGALNTNDVTIRFPYGFRHVKLVVTDSGARTTTLFIRVWAHDPTNYPPEDGFTGATINGDGGKWSASVGAFDGISSVLDKTFCCIWKTEYHWASGEVAASDEQSVIDNVDFVGRLRTETDTLTSDATYSLTAETQFEIDGPSAQMANIAAPLIFMTNTTSAATSWDEIYKLTPWRALVYLLSEFSTFFYSHSLAFDTVGGADDDTYNALALKSTEPNLWSAVGEIGDGINGVFEFTPQGNVLFSRDTRYLALRGSVPVVANWEMQDAIDISIEHAHRDTVGSVGGAGGWLNTATQEVTPYLAIAPGHAQGEAEGKSQINDQILEADIGVTNGRGELRVRVGNHYMVVNPRDELTIDAPAAYHCLMPSRSERHTWTIPASSAPGQRRDYSTLDYWHLKSISHTHDNQTGLRTVSLTFDLETEGDPAQDFIPPDPVEYPLSISKIPPFSSYPALPEIDYWKIDDIVPPFTGNFNTPDAYDAPALGGNSVMIWGKSGALTDSALYITQSFLSTPSWSNITPCAGHEVKHAVFKNPIASAKEYGAYCLMYDSTADQSTLYKTSNVFAEPVSWTACTAVDGPFDAIRIAENGIYLQGLIEASFVDETLTMYGNSNTWQQMTHTTISGVDYTLTCTGNIIYSVLSGPTCDTFYRFDVGPSQVPWNSTASSRLYSDNASVPSSYPVYRGDHTYTVTLTGDGTAWRWKPYDAAGSYSTNIGNIQIRVQLAGDVAITRYSSDDGTSWGASQNVGTVPVADAVGFDCIKIGSPVICGESGQTRIATSDGGAYSDESNHPSGANPVMLDIPMRVFGSTAKNINDSSPEYLIGSNVNASGENLWYVQDSGSTAITPDATYKPFNPNGVAISYYDSARIAILCSSGLSIKLYTTTNTGGSWTDNGAMGSGTSYIRMRRDDFNGLQLFLADEDNGAGYSSDYGANISYAEYPGSGTVKGIEVYG